MVNPLTREEAEARRADIVNAARWCFLNFGFSKTTLDDVATRAGLSRTLLYRSFRNKEDIFTAVFADWLVSRHPEAKLAAAGKGSAYDRLLAVCRLMVVEPWKDMVGAPMAGEFFDVCARIDPAIEAHHREVLVRCVATILGDDAAATVFVLALDGLLADEPAAQVLEERIALLASPFAARRKGKR
jgi:AcrR family transcriptional regulator